MIRRFWAPQAALTTPLQFEFANLDILDPEGKGIVWQAIAVDPHDGRVLIEVQS